MEKEELEDHDDMRWKYPERAVKRKTNRIRNGFENNIEGWGSVDHSERLITRRETGLRV